MRKRNYFTILILVLVASCRQPKALVYQKIQNFSVQTTGLQQSRISLDVCLYNPNDYSLKLKDADVDIFLNNNPVGKMIVKERIAIPKQDTFLLPVTLNANLQNVFPDALQILFSGEVNLKLTGSLKASRHGIFITIPVNYESKQDLHSGIKF